MDTTTLEDNDLIVMWDVSEHKNFVRFAKEEAHKPTVSLEDAPRVTRTIRLGDLKAYINKRPSLWKRLTSFFPRTRL